MEPPRPGGRAIADVAARLDELAAFGAHDEGIDRGLFTAAEFAARTRFATWCRDAGLTLEQDRAGNLFARRGGEGAPILVGSHLDTVRTGGAYDGAYGVVGALCALETLAERGATPQRPVEIVAWAGEEGSRFPLGTLGSSYVAGMTDDAALAGLFDADGVSFPDAATSATGLLPDVRMRTRTRRVAVYLELHVEQGPRLERAGAHLGVVTAIAGQRRYDIVLTGVSGHAGTVSMHGRADALCAAAEVILAVERIGRALGEFVATVGRAVVEPNQANVVPGRALLRVDARSIDRERLVRFEHTLRTACDDIAAARSVGIAVRATEERPPVPMDARLRAALLTLCRARDPRAFELPSGAGHDAMCVARIAPSAMLFVPSAEGASHVAAEYTEPDDLRLGVEALADAILAVDHALAPQG